jgi:hypothetical protein
MASENEIEVFLKDFKFKLGFRDKILFRSDRDKNFKTLLALELTVTLVKQELHKLEIQDYSEGPVEDTLYKEMPMWVFGRLIKGREVYIKISMGRLDSDPICISFHFSEFSMNYPYKPK